MPDPLGLYLSVFVASLVFGSGVVWLVSWRAPHRVAPLRTLGQDGTSFLFNGDLLIDATSAGRRLLGAIDSDSAELDRHDIVSALERRFPGLLSAAQSADGTGRARIEGRRGDGGIDLEWWDGMMRMTLLMDSEQMTMVHPVTMEAMEDEVALLKLLAEETPPLIWRTEDSGQITWANRSYLDLAERLARKSGKGRCIWPPAPIFKTLPTEFDAAGSARISLKLEDDSIAWYDLHVRSTDRGNLFIATDINAVVASEQMSRNFVQTLAKTFAELAVGLAIFDRERRLVMFNPALLDLTGLPPQFLSGRPKIRAFLDRLRDQHMLPEPKDYRSWREEMAALEAAAESGTYAETWSLPNGQTYRVNGRPHPDGAIAFLIEDISAEIALNRQYRTELETAQMVLDSLTDAVAVFAPSGALRLTNHAYDADWGRSSDGLADIRLLEEVETWQDLCAPNPAWTNLRAAARGENTGDAAELRLKDGRSVDCTFRKLRSGDFMVRFNIVQAHGKTQPSQTTVAPIEAQDLRVNG